MRVLVACEESQRVCTAFREKGHEAYSCDIMEPSGGHPEWHILRDCRGLLNGHTQFRTMDGEEHEVKRWDLLIAHPPCTYISAAGACRMYPRKGEIDEERLALAIESKKFFLECLNADCDRVAVENPRPLKIVGLPEPTQLIQPYEFGEPWSKLTCLWLRGLPPLQPTNVLSEYKPWVSCGTSRNKGKKDKSGMSRAGGAQKIRSKTFWCFAKAMAEQWGQIECELIEYG